MDTEYFAQRIQCSRDDKQECLQTIYLLAEICYTYRSGGILALDNLINGNHVKYSAVFLICAVQLFMDAKGVEQIREVLYNCIITSNFSGRQFLNAVVITEVIAALYEEEDLDYIFNFLIPSFFGIDYEETARQAYRDYRKMKYRENGADKGAVRA